MNNFLCPHSNTFLTFNIGWLILLLGSTQTGLAQPTITITNMSKQPVVNTVVEIPWKTVRAAYPSLDTARLRVIQRPDNREIPYQLERRGQQTVRHLLVQVSVGAGQRIALALLPETPAPVASRTYCRFVPERFDDFAWENDRIAFRIYGKALNGRKDNAFGTDVWAKRTENLVLNNWYKTNKYHKDNGEGLDYYHVGFTLGAGDVGTWLGDTINYIHNYIGWQVLDNGPLRSTFRVIFPAYTFGSTTVNTTKIISLDAGSQLSRVEVQVVHNHPGPLPMVVGINLRPQPGVVRLAQREGIMSYWEPTHGPDGTLGIGTVVSAQTGTTNRQTDLTNLVSMQEKHHHALTKLLVSSGKPFVYYHGAAWDKAGQITTADAWSAYLSQFAARYQQPLTITTTPARQSRR